MALLCRWGRSIRLAGLVSGFCFGSALLAQEAPKLPTLPVTPPALPSTPPAIPPMIPPVAPPVVPTVPPLSAPVVPAPSTPTVPASPATKPTVPATPPAPTPPAATTPALPPITSPSVKPANYIPPADTEPSTVTTPKPSVAKVSVGKIEDGSSALPKMLTTAREAHNKLRDYAGFMVRQEKVQGKLLAEQTCEIRYRVNPMSVSVKVVSPKGVAGQDTVYNPARWTKVKHMAGGLDGIRYGFQNLSIDDPKVLVATRHPMTQVGLLAVIDRVEKALATEKRMNNAVQVLMSEYTFLNKPCTRFEIFADKPHPARYAQRIVLFVDKETKLPVRFEAYESGKMSSTEAELLEVVSFVNLKLNVGLGETTFDR